VAPENSCRHFAQATPNSTVRMVYDEGRHHSMEAGARSVFFFRSCTIQPCHLPFLGRRSPKRSDSVIVRVNLRKIGSAAILKALCSLSQTCEAASTFYSFIG